MYDFEVNFDGSRISMWAGVEPNGIKDQWGGPSHNHADFELHVLLQGAVTVDVEGMACGLTARHAIVIAPGRYHCCLPSAGAMERFCLNFSVTPGPLLQCLLQAVPVCRVFPVTEEILAAIAEIGREAASTGAFSQALLQSRLTSLLMYHFRLLELRYETASRPGWMEKISNHEIDLYFEENMKTDAKVEDLAARLYLSRRQVNRLLKEQYGMTFRQKLLRARMEQATRLLQYTELPAYRIAEEVGYSASSSFFHTFRERFGITPEEYRLRSRGKHTGEKA